MKILPDASISWKLTKTLPPISGECLHLAIPPAKPGGLSDFL
jgi:hypothetical protein